MITLCFMICCKFCSYSISGQSAYSALLKVWYCHFAHYYRIGRENSISPESNPSWGLYHCGFISTYSHVGCTQHQLISTYHSLGEASSQTPVMRKYLVILHIQRPPFFSTLNSDIAYFMKLPTTCLFLFPPILFWILFMGRWFYSL